jgi:hypothetical protein
MLPRIWLAVTATLFVGWIGYLGVLNYLSRVTPQPPPLVLRVQAEQAPILVVARLKGNPGGLDETGRARPAAAATVEKVLVGSDEDRGRLKPGEPLVLVDLPKAAGFTGDGPYVLALRRSEREGVYELWPVYAPGWPSLIVHRASDPLEAAVLGWRAGR